MCGGVGEAGIHDLLHRHGRRQLPHHVQPIAAAATAGGGGGGGAAGGVQGRPSPAVPRHGRGAAHDEVAGEGGVPGAHRQVQGRLGGGKGVRRVIR